MSPLAPGVCGAIGTTLSFKKGESPVHRNAVVVGGGDALWLLVSVARLLSTLSLLGPLRMKIDPASLLVLPCSIEFGQYRCPCPSAVPADGEKCSRQASVLELLAQIAHVGGWRRQLSTSRWPGPRYAVVYPLIASRMLLADAWCVGVSSSCVTVASFRSALPRVPASPRMALCPDESISGCKIMLSHPSERSYLACYLASLTWMPGQPGH